MKKSVFPVICLLSFMVVVLMATWDIGYAAEKADKSTKDVLAKVGNKVITKQDMEAVIAAMPPEYQISLQSNEQQQELLNMLIDTQLFAMEAKAKKIDKEKAIVQRIDGMVTSLLAQEYMKRKFSSIGKVTNKEIESYYNTHKSEFIDPSMVKAQHILVKVDVETATPKEIAVAEAKAASIKKELEGGADFSKLAEKYSDDPGSKSRGGDLGFFTKEQMVPEFSKAAFSMKKGEISQPVKTPFGFHIIKVTDIQEDKQMDLKESTPSIQSLLEKQRGKDVMEKELDRLKKKYKVSITKVK
ncbi:MAG: peptidylprolyl isomerase [Syntrophus sp. (in: bacteria)]